MSETAAVTMVSQQSVALIKQSGLWTRIVSVVLALVFLLMVLTGLAAIFMGVAVIRHKSDQLPTVLLGALYLLLSLFYPIPILFLFKYASHAKAFARNPQEQSLERALKSQKSFWKSVVITMFVGIFVVIVLSIGVLVLALSDPRMFR